MPWKLDIHEIIQHHENFMNLTNPHPMDAHLTDAITALYKALLGLIVMVLNQFNSSSKFRLFRVLAFRKDEVLERIEKLDAQARIVEEQVLWRLQMSSLAEGNPGAMAREMFGMKDRIVQLENEVAELKKIVEAATRGRRFR